MSFLFKILALIYLLTMSSCSLLDQSKLAFEEEPSCGFSQDSYGQRVSWKDRRPVVIYTANSWPKQYLVAAQKAVAVWNETYGAETLKIVNDPSKVAASPQKDRVNGLYWLETWSEDRNNVQGVTTMQVDGSQFLDGDVKINAKNFRYYEDPPSPEMQVHMESLLIHEFGHLLGLKHNAIMPTVMAPTLPYNVERVKVSQTDLDSLNCEYGNAK